MYAIVQDQIDDFSEQIIVDFPVAIGDCGILHTRDNSSQVVGTRMSKALMLINATSGA
jgi:hypothetical protein